MINLDRYKQLLKRLEYEKMCLDNLKEYMDNIQNEFLNIDIDKLINEMKGYKNSRNAIINDKIKKINYFF